MNQRISLILNVVLTIAVIGLYVLHFRSGNTSSANPSGEDSSSVKESTVKLEDLPSIKSGNGAIAFIDFEKLTDKYQFYKDGVKSLENDYKRKEGELMKKQKNLEENYARYQQLAPSLTPEIRAQREKEIMDEEKRLFDLRDRLAKDLTDKETNFNKDFLLKIDNYLKGLSAEKNYSYIFTYVKGGPSSIVYASDSLNITTEVVNSLNAQYKQGK